MPIDAETKLFIKEALDESNARQENRVTKKILGPSAIIMLLLGFLLNNSMKLRADVSSVATQVQNNTAQISLNVESIDNAEKMWMKYFEDNAGIGAVPESTKVLLSGAVNPKDIYGAKP